VLSRIAPRAMALFHLLTRSSWQEAQARGEYRAALDRDGFIHLSTERQWPGARARFFAGVPDVVLLVIDDTRLRSPVRFERVDGDDFPHLYGALDLDAVIEVRLLDP
jgi:uncharacterized protein (DUF952 family)